MSYEVLIQKEEFQNYEKNIVSALRGCINLYWNRPATNPEFLKGKIEGIKEALMINIEKIKDKETRIKYKTEMRKKVLAFQIEPFLPEENKE